MEFEYGCENRVLNDEVIQMIKSNGFEVPFTDEEEEIQNSFIINNF